MVDTTREFAEVNEIVHCAEARLRGDLARPDLAAHLRQLQEAEKAKLKFTLVQQVLPPTPRVPPSATSAPTCVIPAFLGLGDCIQSS